MKKKDLPLIKKPRSGKVFLKTSKLTGKLKKKKNKRFAKLLYFRAVLNLKLKRRFSFKYSYVHKLVQIFKNLIFKKEFFFFRNFFLNVKVKNELSLFLIPYFNFEKQFLFKFIEYQNLVSNSFNNSIFFKKKYGIKTNIGPNYLVTSDNVIANEDPKDPIFFIKNHIQLEEEVNTSLINFTFSINFNIFFFSLVDIYKIIIYLHFKKLFN